ncbi:MAG: helix-turn-helix domain-containing protein [Pseudomonadota bacterium]
MRVRVSNDISHWVRFFLTGVTETADKGRSVFSEILELRNQAEQSVLSLGRRAANARQVVNLLYRQPMVTAGQVETAVGVSTPTANKLIRELINLGILKEVTGQQRGRMYAFESYLKLFFS